MDEAYEFDRVAAFVARHGAARVAVQFPEALLGASPAVATALEDRLGGPEVYILGDAIAEGAVDCVAAAHVDAEAIVLVGPACLAPPPADAVPVLFVVGPAPTIDAAAVGRTVADVLAADEDAEDAPLLVLAAPEFCRAAPAIAAAAGVALGVSTAAARLPRHVRVAPGDDDDEPPAGLVVAGLETSLADEAELRSHRVAFVGPPGPLADAVLLRCAACVGGGCCVVDPTGGAGVDAAAARTAATRRLARRRHALGRARSATRWGVVVAAAGRLKDGSETAKACDAALKKAGKASYVLAVGPITPAKLANFAELEALCVVGADVAALERLGREVPVPLVAASELAVALDKKAWLPEDGPFYSCDLADLDIAGLEAAAPEDDSEPDFELAAGAGRPRVALAYEPPEEAAGGAVVEWKSAAADFLGGRDWRGLEVRAGETPVHVASEGRSGVASGYAEEGV